MLSLSPRIILQHGFLTDAECDDLIKIGANRLMASKTVTEASGAVEKGAVTDVRRSKNHFFEAPDLFTGRHSEAAPDANHSVADLLQNVNRKVEALSHYPASHSEMLQVQKYGVGGYYQIHHDGEDRPATALLYLSDVAAVCSRTTPVTQPDHT